MVYEEQKKSLPARKRSSTPDRVTIALGLGLNGELQPLLELDNAACLFFGPIESFVS
jgi:hypothetical protein